MNEKLEIALINAAKAFLATYQNVQSVQTVQVTHNTGSTKIERSNGIPIHCGKPMKESRFCKDPNKDFYYCQGKLEDGTYCKFKAGRI